MDYEKKYKQALERARQFSEKPYLEDSKGIVDYIFPELKVSEGERIRKAIKLMYSFLPNKPKYIGDVSVEDMFAWLEKQGEQKPAEWSEEDERMMMFCCDYLDDNQKSWLLSLKGRVQPQPKQKLSKEDADTLDFLIDYLGNEIKNTSPYGIIGGLDKAVVLLKAIKEGGVTLYLQAAYDKPVIKWSGGDEAHLHSLITHLEQWIESNPDTTGADIQGENIAWLKSLRPRSHWKPSDEQMDALETAVSSLQSTALESLYQDLKRL